MQLHTCKESVRTYIYAAVQVLQLPCFKFYTLAWKWASFRGAMDSLFYHGCSAQDAKLGWNQRRRLWTFLSLLMEIPTVTIAGCTGIITIAGCTGMPAITITITGTLNACKLCKIAAIDWIGAMRSNWSRLMVDQCMMMCRFVWWMNLKPLTGGSQDKCCTSHAALIGAVDRCATCNFAQASKHIYESMLIKQTSSFQLGLTSTDWIHRKPWKQFLKGFQ